MPGKPGPKREARSSSPWREPAFLWMLIAISTIALLLLLGVFDRARAQAGPVCMPLELLVSRVKERFGEDLAWTGTVRSSIGTAKAMLFQSRKGSWTLVVVQGVVACIVAGGSEGEPLATGLPI